MLSSLISFSYMFVILLCSSSCKKTDDMIPNIQDTTSVPNNNDATSSELIITFGTRTFNATLLTNPTAEEFKRRLPMTVVMNELNGNEKYFDLAESLPTNVSNPGIINNGDLMLYGSNTLVLFYKTISTSYSYTKLGNIDDITGLASAIGSGKVAVTFKLQ